MRRRSSSNFSLGITVPSPHPGLHHKAKYKTFVCRPDEEFRLTFLKIWFGWLFVKFSSLAYLRFVRLTVYWYHCMLIRVHCFFWQVSLATCFGALLHYVKLVAKTTVTDTTFLITTGVSYLVTLILFLTIAFDLQQKFIRSTKTCNILVSYTKTIRYNEQGSITFY